MSTTTTTLTESHVLEDDDVKTMHSAIGDESRLRFPLSPKRKLAGTGDGGAAEKRYRGDETEQQKPKQQGGGGGGGCECQCKGGEDEGKQQNGGCKCIGGEHEMEESESESESEGEMKLPDYMVEYYKKISDILGVDIGVGTLGGGCDGVEYMDEDDQQIGDMSSMLTAYPELLEKWSGTDPLLCCSNPFTDLDFKHDTKLYNDLKTFGENTVKDLNARYNYKEASFQDIERVSSCPASCNHRVVTLKAIDCSHQLLQIVLQGQLPLEDFAQAKPNQFIMLEYCTVR